MRLVCLLGAICCVVAVGCGRPPRVVDVEGTITLAGGAWPKEGMLVFEPTESGGDRTLPRVPGLAMFTTDGRFSANTSDGSKGLRPGRYVIRVECWSREPSMYEPTGESLVPAKYRQASTSGLTAEVPQDARNVTLLFDVRP